MRRISNLKHVKTFHQLTLASAAKELKIIILRCGH